MTRSEQIEQAAREVVNEYDEVPMLNVAPLMRLRAALALPADAPAPSPEVCPTCDGTGSVGPEGESWKHWLDLPPGSDIAMRMGIVYRVMGVEVLKIRAPRPGKGDAT